MNAMQGSQEHEAFSPVRRRLLNVEDITYFRTLADVNINMYF